MTQTKKFSLSNALMRIDCDILSAAVLLLIALQPLYGIFDVVDSQSDLIALFYGKATAIRVLGIFGLCIGVISFYQNLKNYGTAFLKKKFLRNPWNLIFLLLLLWSVVTTITAVSPYKAFYSYAYRYEGLISYFAYAGVYICGSLVRDDERRRRIIDFALIVAAVLAVFTMLSQVDGNEETIIARSNMVIAWSGTFINTNHYGYYLCLVLMLSAGRLVYSEKPWAKVLFIASFALNEYILLKNSSFGPFLAVSIGLIALFIVSTIRDGIKKSWWLAIPFAILFLMDLANKMTMMKAYVSTFREMMEVIGVANNAASSGQSVTEALSSEQNVGSGRMEIWLAAIEVWKKHMVLGCGPENIPWQMYAEGLLDTYEAVHNEYIQVLAEMGIPGLMFFCGGHGTFFVYNIIRMKKTKPASLIAYAAAATYLISAAFGITITVSEVFMFFVLGLANGSQTSDRLDELEAVLPEGEML